MRGIIGSFAQQGEANRESYQVFHKELAVDQREAAEEDQLAKAEKQAEQLKLVNDLRSQAESVKEANHSIGEALEDWGETIDDARDDARDDYDDCIRDAEKARRRLRCATKGKGGMPTSNRPVGAQKSIKTSSMLQKPSSTIKPVA